MALRVVSEGPVKIRRATVDAAWRRRAEGVRLLVRDADCRGLMLAVNPTGMTWRFDYRPRGVDVHTGRRWATQSITIGNPATHSPDAARAVANKAKGQTAAGADPAAEKRAAIAAERRQRAATLGRLLDQYAKVLPTRPKLRGAGLPCPRHAREDAARARAAVAAMEAQGTPAAELTPADVQRGCWTPRRSIIALPSPASAACAVSSIGARRPGTSKPTPARWSRRRAVQSPFQPGRTS